jgi:hypothetical protein
MTRHTEPVKTTLGWKRVTIPGRFPKEPCVTCRSKVRNGVSALSHSTPGTLDFRVMCNTCYRAIMVDGRDPKGGDN